MRRLAFAIVAASAFNAACATNKNAGYGNDDGGGASDADVIEQTDAGLGSDVDFGGDAPSDALLTFDSACATATEQAKTETLPVDIIWVVDNSVSMAPAVAEIKTGLNAFAASIAAKNLDYKVIMLALKSATSPITFGGGTRYPVCIPPPLSGDSNCGNGPRFFHSSIDILSTQPLEQFLGTLGQTTGYVAGNPRGGEAWSQELRQTATKTIVVVTDDNSRLSAIDFETFAGGANPNNASLVLPAGVLHPSRNGQFDGYVFAGLYGWGSTTVDSTKCTYPNNSQPPSAGMTYSTLVRKTSGPRAKICDGSAAWTPFFDAIAQAVVQTSRLSCTLDIPTPQGQTLDPGAVNVEINGNGMTTVLTKVADLAACGTSTSWYYDNDAMPTKVILCPAACAAAQLTVGVGKTGRIDVLFGCKTVIR